MKTFLNKLITVTYTTVFIVVSFFTTPVYAQEDSHYGFGVSPMTEKIILNPGDTFESSFVVTNPAKNTGNLTYAVSLSPFYATEDYNITYEETGNYNQIVDWITLRNSGGTIAPNETANINFVINVPSDAPAGGQYAAIIVKTATSEGENGDSSTTDVQIGQAMAIAHTIFAEITGTTVHDGNIGSINLPSFMISGNIAGSTTIENTGNTHETATYKLQIYPLFSSEEIFTNEEDPDTSVILPNRSRYHETVWSDTPAIGIFNVVYTIEFAGVTKQVSKMVIICPIWLLFIIIFAIVALIIWLVVRAKSRKGGRARAEA